MLWPSSSISRSKKKQVFLQPVSIKQGNKLTPWTTLKEKQIRLCTKFFLPVKFLKIFLSNISSVFRYSPLFHLITIDKSCCNSFYGCAITIRINYSSFSYKCQKRENKCLALVSKHDNFFITDQIFLWGFPTFKDSKIL